MQDNLPPSQSGASSTSAQALPWHQVGPHRFRTEGDIIHWQFFGEVTLEHVQIGTSAADGIKESHGYCLTLMNAGGVTRMTAEARRFLGHRAKQRRYESPLAIFNAGLMGIVISRLVSSVTRLVRGTEPNFSIHKNEAEARAWLAKQRRHMRQPS